MTALLSVGLATAAEGQRTREWETACEAGAAKKCYDLARAYRNGKESLAKDAVRAGELYTKACTKESPPACQEYGEALLAGLEGIGPDTALAMKMLDRACNLDPEGKAGKTAGMIGGRRRCQTIVELHQKLPPKSREDSVTVKVTVGRACNRGELETACALLTGPWRAFPDSVGLDDSVKRRLAREREAAERKRLADSARVADSARAADSIKARKPPVILKLDRQWPERDIRKRRQLTIRCDNDSPLSCFDLADMWRRGKGGPADPARAKAILDKACSLDPKHCPSDKRPPSRG